MSDDRIKKANDQVRRMDDLFMDDLFSMSDEELLKEALEEGVDLKAVGEAGRRSLERAQLEVGRKRMTMIRREMELNSRRPPARPARGAPQAGLRDILARNKAAASKLTMAARNESGSLDDDEEGILEDFLELGAIPKEGEEDK